MSRSLSQTRTWIRTGTELVGTVLNELSDPELDAPSALPGWTRKHVLAHLAANADALCNLVAWAETGIETRMYSSTTQRNDDIDAGSLRPATELRAWFTRAAARLESGMDVLTEAQWTRTVVTAQGRSVPATEIPWLRSREVLIHAVDFGTGRTFEALPADFLLALVEDICSKRASGTGPALEVRTPQGDTWSIPDDGDAVIVIGELPQIAAYLAGRPFTSVTTTDGGAPPALGAWL